jgi:hypothetical protein
LGTGGDRDRGNARVAAGGVGDGKGLVAGRDERDPGWECVRPSVGGLKRVIGWQDNPCIQVGAGERHRGLVVDSDIPIRVPGGDRNIERGARRDSEAADSGEVDVTDNQGFDHFYTDKGLVTLTDPAVVGTPVNVNADTGTLFNGAVATFASPQQRLPPLLQLWRSVSSTFIVFIQCLPRHPLTFNTRVDILAHHLCSCLM